MNVLPPTQYDRLFQGTVTVQRGDQAFMEMYCPKSTLPLTLGCARRGLNADGTYSNLSCRIIIADDDPLEAAGHDWLTVLRHEIGHCNGWPGDHKGARAAER
jgi:hypothetical protein